MDWLDRMNSAMDYVEANLADDISYDKIARLACCSAYHFQRMFPFVTGVTLSEYIRRRRLTLAAFELQTTGAKVIDVALKYGYESQAAFSRAFKSLHGVIPVSARDMGVSLKAYPRMTFSISIKGDIVMDYRIVERPEFEMFGVVGEIGAGNPYSTVPEFCKKCDDENVTDEMNQLLGRFHDTCLHSALYDFSDDGFKYMICYYLPKGLEIPTKFAKLSVPAMTWAAFSFPGRDCGMEEFRRRIWNEWFPTSEYEQVKGPEFEMCYGQASHNNILGEVWVPVRKKYSKNT